MKRTLALLSAIGVTLLIGHSTNSQTPSRGDIRKQIELKRAELQALEEQFLAPTEADREAYATLLSQPDSGIIRLLPREIFDSEGYRQVTKTITMRGGGAYYSFSRLTHEYGYGSDLELNSGYLSVGFAGCDYGMLLKLGQVQLTDVTVEYPGVKYLATYEAAASEPEARIEQRRFGSGTEIDGTIFKTRAPLEAGSSYILRSINFEVSDVLVAFQVVRKDDDGSAIIAWRLLKKYAKPTLMKPKIAESIIR
jgi:hypothetical protein